MGTHDAEASRGMALTAIALSRVPRTQEIAAVPRWRISAPLSTAIENCTLSIRKETGQCPRSRGDLAASGHGTAMYVSRTVATQDAGDPSVPQRAIAYLCQGEE